MIQHISVKQIFRDSHPKWVTRTWLLRDFPIHSIVFEKSEIRPPASGDGTHSEENDTEHGDVHNSHHTIPLLLPGHAVLLDAEMTAVLTCASRLPGL